MKAGNKTGPVQNIRPLGFQWETKDPFLFCVHHEDRFPEGNEQMGPDQKFLAGRRLGEDFTIRDGFRMYHGKTVPGFPGHPHCGFETITIVREGLVDHADSLGAAGRYGNGDVQWMTAGKGVQHSEMFPLLNRDKPNPLELFQVWLNLPARSKQAAPHFKMLWSDRIPRYEHRDNHTRKTEVEIIAGDLGDKKALPAPPDSWASDPGNKVAVWSVTMEPGARWTIPGAGAGINRSLYFYSGEEITIGGHKVNPNHAIDVEPHVDLELENGNKESKLLILQGRPIGEQVIRYGPFVMNTREEINEAFEEFRRTQFGGWPWPDYAQVHARGKGRFALHADGTLEEKE